MAEPIKDGGPAFPVLEHNAQGTLELTCTGMTLRDYLAAHAPSEPQSWFTPVVAPQPKEPEFPNHLTIEEREQLGYVLKNAEHIDLKRELPGMQGLHDYVRALREYRKASTHWDAEHQRQRYAQWPWAWADAMLKAREVRNG